MDPQTQRTLAADLFNYTWTLIEKPDRTERETDLMIDSAHALAFLLGVGRRAGQPRAGRVADLEGVRGSEAARAESLPRPALPPGL